MKEYKRYLDMIRAHLNDMALDLDAETLDKLVEAELKKPANRMDTYLVNLCLSALVAYRIYSSDEQQKNQT
ncbi:MAG: hypothetical protein IK955_03090 [Clostridia bacterium]|nr:hypothetical protein [Clostridia bacterium]